MAKTIAVTGKGGTGKTTIAALLLRELIRKDVRPVLAIDADPNSTLGEALGVVPTSVLADIGDEIRGNTPEGVSKPRYADLLFQQRVEEADGFDLLTMGRPEGPGCYCYVNELLRQSIRKLRGNYEVVLVDNAAGMEHISRLVTDDIDSMVIVCEPTVISIVTAARISRLADSLPYRVGQRHLVVNRVPNGGLEPAVEAKRAELGLPEPLLVPRSAAVMDVWNAGRSLLSENGDLPSLDNLVAVVGV